MGFTEKEVREALKDAAQKCQARCHFMGSISDDVSIKAYRLLEENLSSFFDPSKAIDFSFEEKYRRVFKPTAE